MSEDAPRPLVFVDDEPRIARVLGLLARRVGVEARVFTDAEEALAFLNTHRVCGVLCDYRMPKMTGVELLERLDEDTPGYLMTGELGKASALEDNPRVTGVLRKPVPPDELIALMRALAGA